MTKKATGKYFIDFWDVLKKTAKRWNDADPFRQSAIIAFYAIFSLPALLVIIITIAGYAFGEEAIEGKLSGQIAEMLGADAAEMVELMVANAAKTEASNLMMIVGIAILIFGSTTVFIQLQKSLNRIWGVRPIPEKAWLKYLKDRLFSFGIILVIGFLLLISLVVTSTLTIFSDLIKQYVPEVFMVGFHLINIVASLSIIATLFAMMFKILPDAIIRWKSVWKGAFLTAVLFEIGKYGISIYFGKADPASMYGAAGSIILILLWISYVCMILFFGAEFTKQYAIKFGFGIIPSASAELVDRRLDDPYELE
ncbi:MAG: YihY/virulence factor BrkB family protein [Bacteroidetes bacterium]|nr:YihY/virulence factor BrkB family protein [Bacteroidota bacterium]